jgi:hypothetical protein
VIELDIGSRNRPRMNNDRRMAGRRDLGEIQAESVPGAPGRIADLRTVKGLFRIIAMFLLLFGRHTNRNHPV